MIVVQAVGINGFTLYDVIADVPISSGISFFPILCGPRSIVCQSWNSMPLVKREGVCMTQAQLNLVIYLCDISNYYGEGHVTQA